jgi:hypothetical protein
LQEFIFILYERVSTFFIFTWITFAFPKDKQADYYDFLLPNNSRHHYEYYVPDLLLYK